MTEPSREQITINKIIDSDFYNKNNASTGMCIAALRANHRPSPVITNVELVWLQSAIERYMWDQLGWGLGYMSSALEHAGYGHYTGAMLVDFYRNWDNRPMEMKPNIFIRLYRRIFK